MSDQMVFTDSGGNQVAAVVSIPPGARHVIILSHGFASDKDGRTSRAFENEFNGIGVGTVRYDYFGHGPLYCLEGKLSVRRDVTLSNAVTSLRRVVSFVEERGCIPSLMGNSFGGLLSLVVAAENKKIKALILKSPVTNPIALWTDRLGTSGIQEWK